MIDRPLAAPPAAVAAPPLRPLDFSWTIVPHTHWDREWYQPFEAFRLRLARTIDDLLDLLDRDPEFTAFTLDGQSVILEDYLALHPWQEPRIRAHLASGRLVAGPAYVLPDEFLAPQEALVRNLLIGSAVARGLGATPMRVGYQPDPFGHVAQLPQILRGFGLDSLIFWRGLGEAAEHVGSLFSWRAPDGSTVLAIRQLGGYGNASELGRWGRDGRDHGDQPDAWEDVAVDRLARFLERFEPEVRRDSTSALLLCNGSDHQPAWVPLTRMTGAIRRAHPGIDVRIGTYEDHVRALEPAREGLPVVEGELRDGRDAHILRGIDSVRMYLKQANEAASQALLAGETLAALAVLAGRARYPSSALQRAWKLLLRNQPHDSISGCSVDDVHTEMLVRYRKVEQLADRIATESVAALAGETATWAPERPARDWVSVVNPLPSARRVLVDLPLPRELAGTGRLVAETADGELPAQRVGRGAAAVSVDVPGFGATTLRLRKSRFRDSHGRTMADAATGPVGTTSIENEHYRVSAEADGTFTITELASGRSIAGVGRLEDVADRGDEYTFCPVDGDAGWSSTSCRARARLITAGPVVAELEVTLRGALPAGLSRDRRRRVGRVPFRVRTVARLVAGIDRVELRTVVENAARDHRLRVIVPAPDAARTEPIRAEGHFAVLRRPARPPVPSNPAGWAELPQPMQHTTGFVAAGSTVVHAKGLPEYEAIERADGGLDLALTLLRCVGWLSRDDLATRPGGAGPAIETPDAQCLGRQTFEYAVELSGDRDDPALVRSSADYRQAVRVGPPSADPGAILAVDGDVAFAALKGAEAGDGVVLRVYDPGATPAEVQVRAPGQVRRVRLDETPMDGQGAVVEAPTVLEAGEIGSFWVAADGPRRDLE